MICICYFALLASMLNAVCSLHVSLFVRLFDLINWINLFDSARFCLAGKSVVDFRRFVKRA